jgi:hypothetical protein
MAIRPVQFSVKFPAEGSTKARLALSRLVGIRELYTDWDGRPYITMPAPFEALRIYDGETLTVRKCRELSKAIGYFAAHDGMTMPDEARALELLNTATVNAG